MSTNYAYSDGSNWGLQYIHPAVLAIVSKELAYIKSLLTIPYDEQGTAHIAAGTNLMKHKDTRSERQAAILVPLYPVQDYAPLLFYDKLTDAEPSAVVTREQFPALFNPQALHAVNNNGPHDRFNLQLTFYTPYEKLAELHRDGKLFKSVPSWP